MDAPAAYTATLVLALALALDWWLGEARRFHPLAGFGRIAEALERALNRDRTAGTAPGTAAAVVGAGAAALMLAVLPPVLAAAALPAPTLSLTLDGALVLATHLFVLYLCIGARSLQQHAHAVQQRLAANDLAGARLAIARMVSRDPSQLTPTRIAVAGVESVVENGNDALFGVFLWYALLGLPGAVGYRLINTLDAMWGYRNARFNHFGRSAARVDDVLNWLPARLTALGYCIAGNLKTGWHCQRRQGRSWKSPNAGIVMAAGSGALQVTTGGAEIYDGKLQQRPQLGCGPAPTANDISRALRLVSRSIVPWFALTLVLENLARLAASLVF